MNNNIEIELEKLLKSYYNRVKFATYSLKTLEKIGICVAFELLYRETSFDNFVVFFLSLITLAVLSYYERGVINASFETKMKYALPTLELFTLYNISLIGFLIWKVLS